MKSSRFVCCIVIILVLSACAVGPDYVRPTIAVPAAFKENWKTATPLDQQLHGKWWEIFRDPQLNALIEKVTISNQNLAQAEAQFRQAQALVASARSAYFPGLSAAGTMTRSSNTRSGNASHTLTLNSSWEADVWGRIWRTVEANQASAQASLADVAVARLSAQASLAQNYLQLRVLDVQQQLLNDTVAAYQKSLQLTRNQYAVGIVAKIDVIQAQAQLKSAQAQALDNGVLRSQLEHAIALLCGQNASLFSIKPVTLLRAVLPSIPVNVPSLLLERRPDVSAAERLVAAANAQIGVAEAAFFPSVMLSASGGFQSNSFANWISMPNRVWSLGPALALTVFDGGARRAQSEQAIAAYDASVAAYKQTVLSSFQEVEDSLSALRILAQEAKIQAETVQSARHAADLILNQYKAGIVNYTSVVTAQTTALNADLAALNIQNRRFAASIMLIKALGGGWQRHSLELINE